MAKEERETPEYVLADALSFGEAVGLREALQEAMAAMAAYGSDIAALRIVSSLYLMALKEEASAFRALERERANPNPEIPLMDTNAGEKARDEQQMIEQMGEG